MSSIGSASGVSAVSGVGIAFTADPAAAALPGIMVPTGRAFMRENHEIDQMPVFGDAKMETGTARRRRIYLTAPRTVIVGQDLDVDEVAGFDTWFEVSLKAGTEYFSAEVSNLGPGLLWWKARWLEPYTAEFLGGRWWKVTGKLMLFGTPSTTPPQPAALAGGVLFDLTGEASALAGQPLTGGVTFALLSATSVSIVGGVTFALLTGTYIPPPSVGAAAGSSAAAAVGIAPSVGSAAGAGFATGAAYGVSMSGVVPIGVAAGVATASGVGIGPAVGSASGGSTVTGFMFTSSSSGGGSLAPDLSWKQPVIIRTTAALPANTYSNGTSGVGATLTANTSGVLVIDGRTLLLGDRILVGDEAAPANNGIYTITTLGTGGGVHYILTRATDADTALRLGHAALYVQTGTLYAHKQYVLNVSSDLITIGTTALTFVTPPALVNFTETANSGTPNGTIPIDAFSAIGTATNIDFAMVPKGNGSVVAKIADNGTAGGNKVGRFSVDLQIGVLGAATQVVASDYSALIAGQLNTISAGGSPGNTGCAIIGGSSNTISGSQNAGNVIAGGTANSISSGANNFICGSGHSITGGTQTTLGGYNHTVGGNNNYNTLFGRGITISAASTGYDYNFAAGFLNGTIAGAYNFLGGFSYSVTGSYNLIGGFSHPSVNGDGMLVSGGDHNATGAYGQISGYRGDMRGISAVRVFSYNMRNARGDRQQMELILSLQTTNATTTAITVGAGAASAINQLVLPAGPSACKVKGQITAINRANGDTSGWDFSAMFKRSSGGTVSLVGAATVTMIGQDAGAATWAVAVVADNTNKCAQITATGVAATTIDWVATIEGVQAA